MTTSHLDIILTLKDRSECNVPEALLDVINSAESYVDLCIRSAALGSAALNRGEAHL